MTFPDPPAAPPPPPPGYPGGPGYGPPPQSSPLRGRTPRRLGWIFLAVGVVLIVVGAVVGVSKALSKVNGFDRVPYPAGGSVTLNGAGKWIVYLESGNVDHLVRVPFKVGVTAPSGQPVPVQYYGNPGAGQKLNKFTYDYNGHHGIAAYQFVAPSAGTYQIQGQELERTVTGNADLAIGRDITTNTVVGGLLIGGGVLFLVAAIVLLIVGFVKRSRHKKELAAAPAGYLGGPPPGYGGTPPGYGTPQSYGGTPPPPGYGQPPGQPPNPGSSPPPSGGWQQS